MPHGVEGKVFLCGPLYASPRIVALVQTAAEMDGMNVTAYVRHLFAKDAQEKGLSGLLGEDGIMSVAGTHRTRPRRPSETKDASLDSEFDVQSAK